MTTPEPAIDVGRSTVETGRLRLVALDAELARLQLEDRPAFFERLGAQRESAWPPFIDDEPELGEELRILTESPEETGWRGWVFLMGWTPGGVDRAVGVGGFSGPPDNAGVVEIHYAMQPSFREQGLATEAVQGLLAWAFADPRVHMIRARTRSHLTASSRVLEKTGFTHVGDEAGENGVTFRLYECRRD